MDLTPLHTAGGEPYRIKKKIREDDLTETFQAEDLSIGREVLLVTVKRGAEEARCREFLLHARSLGQLHHPGILPIYDMGLLKGAYFYATRVPPAVPLGKMLRGTSSLLRLVKSRGYRLRILLSVADTIAFAHSQDVAVGRLGFDSIIVGEHGEVIVYDWSASRWMKRGRQPGEGSDPRNEIVREDLRQLALLGMNLMYYKTPEEDVTIARWDQRARYLPPELQLILDRAFLERPLPYASVEEFKQDLTKHLAGYTLDLQKGDLVMAMRGFYRRHSRPINILLGLFLCGCLALGAFFYQHAQRQEDFEQRESRRREREQQLAEAQRAHDAEQQRLAALEKELKTLDENEARSGETLSERRGHLEKLRSEVADLRKESDQRELRQEELELKTSSMDRALGSVAEERKTIQQELQESLAREHERAGTAGDSAHYELQEWWRAVAVRPEFGDDLARILKRRDEWLAEYLLASCAPRYRKAPLPDAAAAANLSANGAFAAWMGAGMLQIATVQTGKVQSVPLENKLSYVTFSRNARVLHGVAGTNRAVIVMLNEDCSVQANASFLWKPKTYGKPLPYFAPQIFCAFDGKDRLWNFEAREGGGETVEPHDWKLPLKGPILDLKSCPRRELLVVMEERNILHAIIPFSNTPPRSAMRPACDHWGFLPGSDILYFCMKNKIELVEIDGLTVVRSLEAAEDIADIAGGPSSTRLWLKGAGNRWSCCDWTHQPPLPLHSAVLPGDLLYAGREALALRAESGPSAIYDFAPPVDEELAKLGAELAAAPSPLMEKVAGRKLKMTTPEGDERVLEAREDIRDVCRPEPASPHLLLLEGEHLIAVWNIPEARRVLEIGRSPAPLKRITYNAPLKAVLSVEEGGQVRMW